MLCRLKVKNRGIIQDPRKSSDPFQRLINLSFAHSNSTLKTSSKSVHKFLRYFAHRHTDRNENITSSADVKILTFGSVLT